MNQNDVRQQTEVVVRLLDSHEERAKLLAAPAEYFQDLAVSAAFRDAVTMVVKALELEFEAMGEANPYHYEAEGAHMNVDASGVAAAVSAVAAVVSAAAAVTMATSAAKVAASD